MTHVIVASNRLVLKLHSSEYNHRSNYQEALHEDGELDGEVCETFAVGEGGAVVGRGGADEEHDGQQRIDLEVDGGAEDASKIYGDIQARPASRVVFSGVRGPCTPPSRYPASMRMAGGHHRPSRIGPQMVQELPQC